MDTRSPVVTHHAIDDVCGPQAAGRSQPDVTDTSYATHRAMSRSCAPLQSATRTIIRTRSHRRLQHDHISTSPGSTTRGSSRRSLHADDNNYLLMIFPPPHHPGRVWRTDGPDHACPASTAAPGDEQKRKPNNYALGRTQHSDAQVKVKWRHPHPPEPSPSIWRRSLLRFPDIDFQTGSPHRSSNGLLPHAGASSSPSAAKGAVSKNSSRLAGDGAER
jgi:hypothetical protein